MFQFLVFRISFILYFVVVGLSAAPVAAAQNTIFSPTNPDTIAKAVWDQIAVARAASGLSPLTLDRAAIDLAHTRSTDMATHDYFGHYDATGRSFLDLMAAYDLTGQFAGETLQRNNFSDSATEAARGLIASPAHHAILFDPRYQVGGIGHAVGSNGMHYFTIIVIQP